MNVFQPLNLLLMNVGVAVGIIFGALPGLSGGVAVVMFLPFTFYMDPIPGISLLLGMYCGSMFGGSITAILLKTPGTASAAATVADGYALNCQGKPNKALTMALVASTLGGLFSTFMLIFFSPYLASAALKFGPTEYFALALFGLSIIAGVSTGDIFKGIGMGCLGMLVAMIGMDPLDGVQRLSFDNLNLIGGIDLVPATIGLFALAEMFNKSAKGLKKAEVSSIDKKNTEDRLTVKEFKPTIPTILKGSVIGTIIGAIPGTGAAIAAFISYNEARRASKTPEEFGNGSLDGIAAAESANNAVTGSTLIPMLSLGVPGDVVAAIMMGAFLLHGMTPGPGMFTHHLDVVYGIMGSLLLINLFMLVQGKLFTRAFANVNKVPMELLLPTVFLLCVVGVYSSNNSMFDVYLILGFGAIAYLAGQFSLPTAPMLLGIILGPMAEKNFRNALILSGGDYSVFVRYPISLIFLLITVATFVLFILKDMKKNKKTVSDKK